MNKIICVVILFFFVLYSTGYAASLNKHINKQQANEKPSQFIREALGEIPKAQVLWLSKNEKKVIADILQHKFNRLRVRYWLKTTKEQNKQDKTQQAITQQETVWILDEIGKEKPITIGVHIKNHQIVTLKVLTYRESRGDEVRHTFFTKQFNFAKLIKNNELDRHIDGITGATLSVRALTKVARLSLWLDNKVNAQ